MAENKKVEKLIEQLSDSDWEKQRKAAEALGKLGDASAVPHLITALSDSDGSVRRYAAEVLGKVGDKSATPHLIKTLSDSDWYVRLSAVESLRELGITQASRIELNFFPDSWPRAGEFHRQPVEIANNGGGQAFDLRLSLSGPAVGNEVSLRFATLPLGEKAAGTITIRPESPGSAVPLYWELTYHDINGPNQKLAGTSYIADPYP